MSEKRNRFRVVGSVVLPIVVAAGLVVAGQSVAGAAPYQCIRQGNEYRAWCADVAAVPSGQTLPLRQKAAADSALVSGTAYSNGDRLALGCWAHSPFMEAIDGDTWWFSVYDPEDNAITGYVSDHNLTTGNLTDWNTEIPQCSGDTGTPPTSLDPYQCLHDGGQYRGWCANITDVSDLSYLHMSQQPSLNAPHVTAIAYNDNSPVALSCWTEQPGEAVEGDPYWFGVFDPNVRSVAGYISDYYLTTGGHGDWQSIVTDQCTGVKPPARVTKVNNGLDPKDAEQKCPAVDGKPDLQPLRLRTTTVTVGKDNSISTSDSGVQQIGTVQNCLARQSTSPTSGVLFSRTHVRLNWTGTPPTPVWDLTGRVMSMNTAMSGGHTLIPRFGALSTVYPPLQPGCWPQACQSETYFLSRAMSGPDTGRTGFVQPREDYTYESSPITNPTCGADYRIVAYRNTSQPGGDNFETEKRPVLPSGVSYQQAGWMPRPGTFDFENVTFAWPSSKAFDATMWHDEARDRVALRTEGARVEVEYSIDLGDKVVKREVDVLTADGTALEIKTGQATSTRSDFADQIAKDAALLDSPSSGIHAVKWLFLADPRNPANQGPSDSVKAALSAVNIQWSQDSAGVLCQR